MRCNLLVLLYFLSFGFVQAQTDSSQIFIIAQTQYVGNVKTKVFILNRELTYQIGDQITLNQLEVKLIRSKENLFNTSLFNSVDYVLDIQDSNKVKITFHLEERWYVWPYPIFENGDRNFNTWWQTKDFSRLTYGVFLNWFNFRGRNETFQVMTKLGFENQFSLGYDIPNLNKKKTLGLYVASGYAEYKEVNYSSIDNKRVFYKKEDGPARQVVFANIDLSFRKSLNSRHKLGLSFHQIIIDSAITDLTTDYLKGNTQQSEFFTLSYYGKYDTRDYIDYPLKGYKIETYITKYGLGILENEQLNVLTVQGGFYWHLPLHNRWYLANSVVGKTTFFDATPYVIQRGLGYKNFVRGYELYVMDSEKYGVAKTNLKYNLLKKREVNLGWLPFDQFNKPYFSLYLNAFFDIGYAHDALYGPENLLSNKWAYGYGMGLDIMAFYDFVMRIEYAFNRESESGWFLHFKKSI